VLEDLPSELLLELVPFDLAELELLFLAGTSLRLRDLLRRTQEVQV